MPSFQEQVLMITNQYLKLPTPERQNRVKRFLYPHNNHQQARKIEAIIPNSTALTPQREYKLWKSILSELRQLKPSTTYTLGWFFSLSFQSTLLNDFIALFTNRMLVVFKKTVDIPLCTLIGRTPIPKELDKIINDMEGYLDAALGAYNNRDSLQSTVDSLLVQIAPL